MKLGDKPLHFKKNFCAPQNSPTEFLATEKYSSKTENSEKKQLRANRTWKYPHEFDPCIIFNKDKNYCKKTI